MKKTRKELELECEFLRLQLQKINKIGDGCTDISKLSYTLGRIIAMSDTELLNHNIDFIISRYKNNLE